MRCPALVLASQNKEQTVMQGVSLIFYISLTQIPVALPHLKTNIRLTPHHSSNMSQGLRGVHTLL